MIKMVTIWKDINGWERYYEINDDGQVRNKINNNLIIGDCNSCGYPRVCLYNKNNNPNKQRFFRHRLVAEHFIDNPDNLSEVNHIDMDILNYQRNNLEWCNRTYNHRESLINRNRNYKPFIVEFDNGKIIKYDFATDLAELLGLSNRTILNWVNKKSTSYIKYGIKSIDYF